MLWKTHILFSTLILLGIFKYFEDSLRYTWLEWVLFGVLVIFFTLLVDIDEEDSWIGRRIPGSKIINWVFGHRGIVHSIWIPLIVGGLLHYWGLSFVAFALVIGWCSHLIMDAITVQGIDFLYPFNFKISGPVKVGGWMELVISIGFGLMGVILIFLR